MIQIASQHQPSSLSWSPSSFVLEWQYPAEHLAYLRTYYLQTCLSHRTPCLDSSLHAQYQCSTEQSRLWTNAHRRYRCFHLYVIATRKTSFKLTNTPLWNLLPTVLKESLRMGRGENENYFEISRLKCHSHYFTTLQPPYGFPLQSICIWVVKPTGWKCKCQEIWVISPNQIAGEKEWKLKRAHRTPSWQNKDKLM